VLVTRQDMKGSIQRLRSYMQGREFCFANVASLAKRNNKVSKSRYRYGIEDKIL